MNPEEADYFYMPIYSSCFIFPIHCWADGPWWYAPAGSRVIHVANMVIEAKECVSTPLTASICPRVMHVTNMMVEAKEWVRSHFPYWDRRGGRDHIFLMTHDEGACYAPTEIYNSSIFLTHWGRMDKEHRSNTAFTPDNYTQEHSHPEWQPDGWLNLIEGHACYTPGKDLVIPALKFPHHFSKSPLLGHPPPGEGPNTTKDGRDILMFFRGDVGEHRLEMYSRGIRQKIHKLHKEGNWSTKYNIQYGNSNEVPGDYSSLIARSKFCLVPPGDGWSPRAEDAILHGCIPVVTMDGVHAVFESILDWKTFSIRIAEDQLAQLPEILLSVPNNVITKMQQNLRLAYVQHPLLSKELRGIENTNRGQWEGTYSDEGVDDGGDSSRRSQVKSPRARAKTYPIEDDAFGTIMQWLYSKIPSTR
eukprot:gene15005-21073_t